MSYPWDESRAEFSTERDVPRRGRRAAHALLYAKSSAKLFDYIPMEHAVMMQLRFDGTLGFPGGYVNYHENITKGLNRELEEEIALKQRNFFSDSDYYGTWIHSYMSTPLVDHFYVKEFTEDEFKKIEMQTLQAKDWGGETMGIIRVPLDCIPQTNKPYGPMPHFLLHNFVGNAREQLVKTIVEKQLVEVENMQHAWAKMIELKHGRDKT